MKKTIQLFSVVAALLLTNQATAQLSSGDCFLKAAHVELGIDTLGWFGSSFAAPAGYHADFTGGRLGFIADPDMDGWTVGTPAFYGDFFLPGTPFEGWELQFDTTKVRAFNGTALTTGVSGSNISYTSVGSVNTGVWQGSFHGLTLKQETSLDTNAMYFVVRVTVTNTDTVAHNNIYYFRTLDPDNEQMQTGAFSTNNYVRYNRPTDSVSLVTATGVVHTNAYLGLGTADTNSRALIYTSWPLSATTDISTVYNQTCTSIGTSYYVDSAMNLDIAIGLIFNIGHLAPVDSAADSVVRTTSMGLHPANSKTVTFFYSFTPAGSDSALVATGAHNPPVGISNTNNASSIVVYPNPVKNILTISGLATTDNYTLVNMMGRSVKFGHGVSNTISTTDLPVGGYILLVTDADGSIKAKIPVQKN